MALNLMTPQYVAPDVTKAPLAGEAIRSSQASTNLAARAQATRDRAQQQQEMQSGIQNAFSQIRLEQGQQQIDMNHQAQVVSLSKQAMDMRHKEAKMPLEMIALENQAAAQRLSIQQSETSLLQQRATLEATPAYNDYADQIQRWVVGQSTDRPPFPPAGLTPALAAQADGMHHNAAKVYLDRIDDAKDVRRREETNQANLSLASGLPVTRATLGVDAQGRPTTSVSLGGGSSTGGTGSTGSRSASGGGYSLLSGAAYYGSEASTGKLTTSKEWQTSYEGYLGDTSSPLHALAEKDIGVRKNWANDRAYEKHAMRFVNAGAARSAAHTLGTVGNDLLATQGSFPFFDQSTGKMDYIVVTKVNERGEVVTPMAESEKEWRDAGYTAPPLSWNPPLSFYVDEEGSRVDIHDPELPKDKHYEEVGGLTDQQVTAINADIHPTLIDAIKGHQPSSTYNDDGTKLKPEDILTRFMKDNVLQVANELDVTDASALEHMKAFADIMLSEWEHSTAKGKDKLDVTKEDLDSFMGEVRRHIRPTIESLGKPDAGKVAERKEADSFGVDRHALEWTKGEEAVDVAKRIGLPMGDMKAYADKYHDQHGAVGTGRWRGGEEKWYGGQGSMGYGPDTGVYETYEDKYRAEGLPWSRDWVDPYWIGTHRKQTFKGTTSERMKGYAKKNYKARQDNAAEAKAQNRKGLKPVPTRP
jgi:hypothetical protein